MSVPAWKKAIIERRKKQEDDQKKKQAEEEAYLATLPPWKRALFQKRERERKQQQQQQQEREKSHSEEPFERSNSFKRRQQQLDQERKTTAPSAGWGRRATPPSPTTKTGESGPTSPSSPTYDHSHHFFPATSGSTQPSHERPPTNRRTSVTTLEAPIHVAERVANTQIPQLHSTWQTRPRASSESTGKKVVSNVKKFSEVKAQTNEMPAWKRDLLQRRKEKAASGGGGGRTGGGQEDERGQRHTSSNTNPSASLAVTRKDSPQESRGVEETDFSVFTHEAPEPVSLLAIKRKLSAKDEISRDLQEPVGIPLNSPVEKISSQNTEESDAGQSSTDTDSQLKSTHTQSDRPLPHDKTQFKKTDHEQKPLSFGRRLSPIEVATRSNHKERSVSPSESRDNAVSSTNKSHDPRITNNRVKNESQTMSSNGNQKLIPKRTAPIAPVTAHPPPKQQQQQQQHNTSTTRPSVKSQQRAVPVNRGTSDPLQQSQVIQTEGVTHHAPIYKEVGEWANVPEDDPKFLSLPMWKQALIKRRRADIAKRMGLTTSVDDVPLTNGSVQKHDQQGNTRNVPSEDRATSILSWKKQMLQRKVEGGSSGQNIMTSFEKKHLANQRDQSSSESGSTVKSLTGRFNDRTSSSSPSPPPTTVTTVRPSPPRSPSPSSSSSKIATPTSSSRPPHLSTGVPPTTTTTHTTRRSFTWTPGEDTMPGETLSDDSSDEEDEGEYTITNIDDTSSSDGEEEDEKGEEENKNGDGSEGVVLLRPPQEIVSTDTTSKERVRKTSSILVSTDRPKKHVSNVHHHCTKLSIELHVWILILVFVSSF